MKFTQTLNTSSWEVLERTLFKIELNVLHVHRVQTVSASIQVQDCVQNGGLGLDVPSHYNFLSDKYDIQREYIKNFNPSVGSRGGWSLSKRSLGERWGTPWTGRQSITGSHRDKRDKQPHTRSHSLLRTI